MPRSRVNPQHPHSRWPWELQPLIHGAASHGSTHRTAPTRLLGDFLGSSHRMEEQSPPCLPCEGQSQGREREAWPKGSGKSCTPQRMNVLESALLPLPVGVEGIRPLACTFPPVHGQQPTSSGAAGRCSLAGRK